MPSNHDIEDISFFPGSNASSSRILYESGDSKRSYKEVKCSPIKSIVILCAVFALIIGIALLAALAHPRIIIQPCSNETTITMKYTPGPLHATNGQPFPWKLIRLPSNIEPLTYAIFLKPNISSFTFEGSVIIKAQVLEKTDFIVLHIKLLDAYNIKVFKTDSIPIKISEYLENILHEQLFIQLAAPLLPSTYINILINYTGNLTDNLAGFYRSSYETPDGQTRWIATTHFEATDARAAFPCFDEPHLKANFTLSMIRKPPYFSLFNTQLIKTEILEDGFYLDSFAPTLKMSTYLVAFVMCDFLNKSAFTHTGVKISVYTPPHLIGQAEFGLDLAVKVLEFYENYYNISYPLNKSDHIAIEDFSAGAMENWGLVTYLSRMLLYNSTQSSTLDQQWVAIVIAHELAHQWFGDLVTMKWWNDLWLNEGFARFVEYLGTNAAMPDWNMMDLFIGDVMNMALYYDGFASSHPISVPVHNPTEIGEIFDAISYEKGASIIRMLEFVIGKDIFNAGVQRYLRAHMYKNAETDDLWKAMTIELQSREKFVNIKEMMDTWTLQMGYPVVTVIRSGSLVEARQHRFLYNAKSQIVEEFHSPFNYSWFIPLTYSTNTLNQNPIQWMKTETISFEIDSDTRWIKMNNEMTGLYRVHYDDKNWLDLIDQLKKNHSIFKPADRANLITDAFALARSGHLNITLALELSTYLINETEYVPWQMALPSFAYLHDMLSSNPNFNLYCNYMKYLLKPMINNVGWGVAGTHSFKLLRTIILDAAVTYGDEETIKLITEEYAHWMLNQTKLPADHKSIVYHGGIRYGGWKEWDYLWGKMVKETPVEKNKMMEALSETNDALILEKYLRMSLDTDWVRSSDTPSVLHGVSSNPAGKVLAWRFFKSNWDIIHSRYHQISLKMKRILLSLVKLFSTQFDYNEVKSFFNEKLGSDYSRSIAQALDRIAMNVDWMERNEKLVIDWLKEKSKVFSLIPKK